MIYQYNRWLDLSFLRNVQVQKKKSGNQATKAKREYLDIVSAFDIETTRIKDIEQSVLYIWQWDFLTPDGIHRTIVGRTWDDLRCFITDLLFYIDSGKSLVVWVHNLSYEFQFISGIYPFANDEVFAVKSRKVLKATMHEKRIEFRCSYLHSNMSLAEYTDKMRVEHRKLSGKEFDYSKMRFPWTLLTDREIEYCVNDVIGLTEALQKEMEFDNDNLYTVPLTSTGYVRRDAKKAMRLISPSFVKSQNLDIELYKMCREAFRGGDTHANRYFSGHVVKDVKSWDRSSSYPDVILNCLYPVGPFTRHYACASEDVREYMCKYKQACLCRVAFYNLRLKDDFDPIPYISRDKCRGLLPSEDGKVKCIYDNGRVLSAGYCETTVTDVDLRIINDCYTWDKIAFVDVATARYGKLPEPFLETVREYYRHKTALKGSDDITDLMLYLKSKSLLNALYGMMAQDPVKQDILYNDGAYDEGTEDPQKLLNEHNKKAFVCYQWGVWVTAWARLRLHEGQRLAGDNVIYWDTDSVKYCGDVEWAEYNKQRMMDSKRNGAFAVDSKGVTHYMGVYEPDGNYTEFCTLGAKKYCYRNRKDGKLYTTIAGVAKDVWVLDENGKEKLEKVGGASELEAAGGISAFQPGFIFKRAGGTESVYNDDPPMHYYDIEGHTVEVVKNVVIKESTYKLGLGADYKTLLDMINDGVL